MTSKLFPNFEPEGLREARLIFDKAGPERSGEKMRVEVQKKGPQYAEVISYLRDAAVAAGNRELEALLSDPETVRLIAAQVELLPGNLSKKWMNAIALTHLQKSHEAFTGEGQDINAAKDKSTTLARECARIFQETLQELQKQAQAYKAAGGGTNFPGLSDAIKKLLEEQAVAGAAKKPSSAEDLKKRFDDLIDLTKDALWAPDKDIQDVPKWTGKLKSVGITDDKIREYATGATEATARRAALLKIIREAGGAKLLSETDREKVETAVRAVDTAIGDVNDQVKAHLDGRFAARVRYLDRFGGSHAGAIIALSINDEGKLALPRFQQRLAILMRKDALDPGEKTGIETALSLGAPVLKSGPEAAETVDKVKSKYAIDASQVQTFLSALLMGGWEAYCAKVNGTALSADKKIVLMKVADKPEIIPAFLGCWDPKNAKKYIEETLHISNPTGVSPSALHARATLPDPVSTTLDTTKLPVDPSTLMALSQADTLVEDNHPSDGVAAKIVEWSIADASGKKILRSQEMLEECLTFLFFTDRSPDGARTANDQAKEEVQKWLADVTVFDHRGDNYYLVTEATLKTKIKALTTPATAAKKIYELLHGRPPVSWKDLVTMHVSEGWKLAKAGAGVWAEYIAALPRNFWDAGDADLLKLLDQRSALDKGKAELEKLLAKSSGAQNLLEGIRAGLHARKDAQDKALRGDPVTSPLDQKEQAHALGLANLEVIKKEFSPLEWGTRSLRLQEFTLWTAMKRWEKDKDHPYRGVEEAKRLLRAAAPRQTHEQQDQFVDDEIGKLKPDERASYEEYINALASMRTAEGRDILSPFKQRGLDVVPSALDLLRHTKDPANPAMNLAAGVGRWTIDPPEKVRTALELILDGPAKEKYIEAFVTKPKDELTYQYQGRTEKVSATDAHLAVLAIQQRLLFEMRGRIRAREEKVEQDEFTNPVDRWLRTGVDSMKELWATDWVGKAEVVAMVAASIWLIHKMWKDTKWGKFALVGIPILLGANAIYKQRTGRDFLGEKLQWKSKDDRALPMEQFKRRGAALHPRYAMLLEPSGRAAIDALTDERSPVPVAELLAWRDSVKSSVDTKKQFSLAAPPALKIARIQEGLGAGGTREKACEVAYYAFESLCVDVAGLNGLNGGNVDTTAELGADKIRQRYVVNRAEGLKPATMFEVIMSECQMPTKEMLENRNYVETFADACGYGRDEGWAIVKKLGVQGWVMIKQGVHVAPEIAGAVKEYAGVKWDGFKNWAALTWAKGKPEMTESIAAVWRFLSTTAVAGGIWLKDVTPDAAEWVIDTSVAGAGKAKDVFWNVLGMLQDNGIVGPVLESLLVAGKKVLGLDIKAEWLTPEYREKRADVALFTKELSAEVGMCATLPSEDLDPVDATRSIPAKYFKKLLGAEGDAVDAPTRMIAMEMAKRKIFSFLAAERIHALSKKQRQSSPDTTPLILPLRPNWPATVSEFNSLQDKDPVYAHLFDQYDLRTMLAAIGDQQTIVGLMRLMGETAPSTTLGSVSKALLWPGIEKYFTRDSAGKFLINGGETLYEIREYVGKALSDAQKQMSPSDYNAYEAYVNTLLTNVMLETILSQVKGPVTDLRLLKEQAKDFRRHLLEKRGLLVTHADAEKWNLKPKIAELNRSENNARIPDELLNLERDNHFRWLLLGEEEPRVRLPGQTSPATPGVAPIQRSVDANDVQRYLGMQPNSPAAIKELLNEALGRVGLNDAQESAIRQKFDALPPAPFDPNDLSAAGCEKSLHRYLGVAESEAKKIGEDLLQQCKSIGNDPGKRFMVANWLSNSIGSMRSQYPGHPRFQRLLDQAAMILLDQVAQEVGSVKKADLPTNPNYQKCEATLVELYRATSQQPDKYTDAVSQLLEYMLYRGDHGAPVNGKTYFEKYKEYLKSKNLPESKYLVNKPWFSSIQSESEGRLGSNYNWDERYVKSWYGMGGQVGAKVNALMKEAEKRPWN